MLGEGHPLPPPARYGLARPPTYTVTCTSPLPSEDFQSTMPGTAGYCSNKIAGCRPIPGDRVIKGQFFHWGTGSGYTEFGTGALATGYPTSYLITRGPAAGYPTSLFDHSGPGGRVSNVLFDHSRPGGRVSSHFLTVLFYAILGTGRVVGRLCGYKISLPNVI